MLDTWRNVKVRNVFVKIFEALKYDRVSNKKEHDYYHDVLNNSFYVLAFYDNFGDIRSDRGWEATELEALNSLDASYNKKRFMNNCNFICCISESPKNQEDNQLIYQLEEDTFGLKKYVLTYTKKEVEDFENKFSKFVPQDILLFLKSNINDNKKFNDFKNGQNENYFSLILKLFIKINNLVFTDSISQENYQELQEIIDEELTKEDLLDFSIRLLSLDLVNNEITDGKLDTVENIIDFFGGIGNEI